MVEYKSVKVDNWGVFFLQKLQNFFNKTDYCDLTLQFQDNSQLKVHRLVLSACTDYFNILEQQCDMSDDILVMPRDLQADVVVPIVNFMYTGTLEFEVNMYGRLLKTAKDMNMTVLLKLLEAHKRTVELPKPNQAHPVLLNKAAGQRMNTYSRPAISAPAVNSPKRTYTQRKIIPVTKIKTEKNVIKSPQTISYLRKTLPEPVQLVAKYANNSSATQKGPSRYDCSDDTSIPDQFESSFDNISYESRPLITASQIIKEEKDLDDDEPSTSSSFEQLRKSYTGTNKRPAPNMSAITSSPPEKKPNLQDVMEYTEAHRMRKEIVAEEFEGTEYVDENYANDDEMSDPYSSKPNTDGSTMVIKNESGNVNHAKIISEVLKKYPHLVKNNKNIKLKIMQKGNSGNPQPAPATAVSPPAAPKAPVLQKVNITPPPATSAPKKIDSKTMHALIAKGAENTTGPWLCLKCGVNGRPISIPSYKSFRRHLVNVHKEKIDPKLCEFCGWRSQKKDELHHHILVKHNIKPPANIHFPKCDECNFVATHNIALKKHQEDAHPKQKMNAHHCIYCNKTFSNEILVYAHMRNNHKERACEDGVMDFDEDDGMDEADKYIPNNELGNGDNKIKIISNITLPTKSIPYVLDAGAHTVSSIGGNTQHTNVNLEPSSEAEALSNVASGIATSLGVMDTNTAISGDNEFHERSTGNTELLPNQYIEAAMANVHGEFNRKDDNHEMTRFVTEEGSALELTASQKADLLQQLQDQRGVVMILNNDGYEQNQEILNENPDQGIVVVYSQTSETDKGSLIESSKKTNESGTTHTETTKNWHESSQESPTKSWEQDSKNRSENSITDDGANSSNYDETMMDIEIPDKPSIVKTGSQEKMSSKTTTKLISALEGDWSEDQDEDGDIGKTKQVKSSEIDVYKKTSLMKTKSKDQKSDRKTNDGDEKELSNDSEAVSSNSEAVKDEKEEHLITEKLIKTEKRGGKIVEKDTSKSDIKTLINDWGDDDDDDENENA